MIRCDRFKSSVLALLSKMDKQSMWKESKALWGKKGIKRWEGERTSLNLDRLWRVEASTFLDQGGNLASVFFLT